METNYQFSLFNLLGKWIKTLFLTTLLHWQAIEISRNENWRFYLKYSSSIAFIGFAIVGLLKPWKVTIAGGQHLVAFKLLEPIPVGSIAIMFTPEVNLGGFSISGEDVETLPGSEFAWLGMGTWGWGWVGALGFSCIHRNHVSIEGQLRWLSCFWRRRWNPSWKWVFLAWVGDLGLGLVGAMGSCCIYWNHVFTGGQLWWLGCFMSKPFLEVSSLSLGWGLMGRTGLDWCLVGLGWIGAQWGRAGLGEVRLGRLTGIG